ncbi:hypothetical protein C5167_001926 [Papaver somniferum]|uniref:Uncharacterized protein n=1 Tax=Papaver somniferum TaxID=3469 RepID=A0A4Y7L087_PAPSO|nr:hypothetical protein C5167_001926 [Papaver somniferum]
MDDYFVQGFENWNELQESEKETERFYLRQLHLVLVPIYLIHVSGANGDFKGSATSDEEMALLDSNETEFVHDHGAVSENTELVNLQTSVKKKDRKWVRAVDEVEIPKMADLNEWKMVEVVLYVGFLGWK